LAPHSEPVYSKSTAGTMKPQLKQNQSETDYDHLDIIKSESQIRHYFSSLGTTADLLNPALPSESFLRERQVTRMQGLMAALKERKGLVRSYLTRCEVRDAKFQKLSKCSDAGQRFEMEHELEALKKDISDIKTRVKTSNENLLKELSLLDASLAPDLHRLIQSYSRASLASSSRLEELHADGV